MEVLLPLVTWLVWLLIVACVLAAALTLGAVAVGFGLFLPIGVGARTVTGEWPRWFRPVLAYTIWALALSLVFGGFALLFLRQPR